MEEHDSGNRTYIVVWGALIVLTAATVAVSYVHLGMMNVVVALFFMHLRYESLLVWGFALTPIFFLVLIIAGTLSDTLFR